MRYIVIFKNKIINAINWDGEQLFEYPLEHDSLEPSEDLPIGAELIDGVWTLQQTTGEEAQTNE